MSRKCARSSLPATVSLDRRPAPDIIPPTCPDVPLPSLFSLPCWPWLLWCSPCRQPGPRPNSATSPWTPVCSPSNPAARVRQHRRDCTGCHGPQGRGDGPGARADITLDRPSDMARPATDFTDLAAQAGASDMIYYGKLVRGGMGTSMPNWGTLYSEEDLWAVIAYIRSFAFGLPLVP
ncbi:MAG: cytochrome c [Chloroflexi bacterium]|nr:MAG: cytochrome c [Chloroflexota bacterium]